RRLSAEAAGPRPSLRPDPPALLGVLSADRRWPRGRAVPEAPAASFGKCGTMNALAKPFMADPSADDLPAAEELARSLADAKPSEIIAAALRTVGRDKLALVSSFGTESAALLKVMSDVDPEIPVIFLDTGWIFEETLAYRDTLIQKLGLRDVRSIKPLEETLAQK